MYYNVCVCTIVCVCVWARAHVRKGLFCGGGNTFAVYAGWQADYRLCVFTQVKDGGCISGKKIILN